MINLDELKYTKQPTELLPCPFCGHEPEIKHSNVYGNNCVRVRCPSCQVGNEPIIEGTYMIFGGKTNVTFTIDEAEQIAVSRWNRRESA